jgi:predicted ester cyclase
MSIAQNKSLVQKYLDAVNAGDLETLRSILSPELLQDHKDALAWIEATFDDHLLKITEIIAEDDKVAIRVDSSGRHTGEWMGIAPSGKEWSNYGVYFCRIEDAKIVDIWWLFDVPNHIKELGGEMIAVTR